MIAVVVLMAGLMMPKMRATNKAKAQRIKCVNNLKEVGLAFRLFPGNGDMFPGQFLKSEGVAMTSIDAVRIFQTLSIESENPELIGPKTLVCPSDKEKREATFFTNLTPKNISYFASLTADETMPQIFLGGDRNLATNGVAVGSGLFGLTTNGSTLSWTKEMHNEQGNVLMGDGSVQQMSSSRLRQAVKEQGISTNYLVVP